MNEPVTLARLVLRALSRRKADHAVLLIWQHCFVEAELGAAGLTNGNLAERTGLSRSHVRKCLRLLAHLGLVLPQRRHANSGFDLILIRRKVSDVVRQDLLRVERGELALDIIRGAVVPTGTEPAVNHEPGLLTEAAREGWFTPLVEVATDSARPPTSSARPPNSSATGVFFLGTQFAKYVNKEVVVNKENLVNTDSNSHNSNLSSITGSGSPITALNAHGEGTAQLDLDTLGIVVEKLAADAADAALARRRETRRRSVGEQLAALPPERQAQIGRVFDEWRVEMGYLDRTLTERRKGVINARLDQGYTEKQFSQVIRWAARDPGCRGHNKYQTPYDDFANLFGSPEKFDKNIRKSAGFISTNAPSLLARPLGSENRKGREF